MSDYLETAARIGARLCRDAIWWRDRCTWLGAATVRAQPEWVVAERTCGPALYDGTAGIALFLQRLADLTGEPRFQRAAHGAIAQALARAGDAPSRFGYYSGCAGIGVAAAAVGVPANGILDGLRPVDADRTFDLIGGGAGSIIGLLALRESRLAVRLGEHLVARANKSAMGWSWTTMRDARDDLTGLAHGTSGIAWALLELYRACGDERFRDAAERALAYERRWYNPERGNWVDLRGEERAYGVAWCHGAPGIALARLRACALLDRPAYRDELSVALETTRASLVPERGNFSLCHGLAGNADVLLSASVALDDVELRAPADELGQWGIEHYEQAGAPWPCGVPKGGETPGLMLGLAGIGWFYLRLLDPVATPSVLLPVP